MTTTPEQRAFNATADGQKAMFYKASRIGVLLAMNRAIRRINPTECWDDGLITSLPDSQIDGMLETIRLTYNTIITAQSKDPQMPIGWAAWFNSGLIAPHIYGQIAVDDIRRGGHYGFPVYKAEGDPVSALLPARRRAALFAHLVESGLSWEAAQTEVRTHLPEPKNP